MERESARKAFNRACQYLNYQATAKWTAYVSAVLAGLTYVALLGILWLYADLLVDHGQLPRFHSLPASAQLRYQTLWKGDTDKALSLEEEEKRWRQEMAQILVDKVDPDLEERVKDHEDYLDQDNGILSLVVRSYAVQDVFAPVVAWFASWNYWARNDPEHPTFFPSFLIGLLIIAMLLAILGALFLFLMRDSAAQSCIEASNRLRRAVYLHTFRMGTLAFRALGPTEAVTVFTRHVEAVHDALYALMTVYFREMVKFSLLFLFSILVGRWLALAFLLFAILVWFCGGLLSAYLGKQGRTATTQASESLTIMRESLMMMRLVKCYLMEAFNRSRVERQLSHSAEVQSIRYRGEAIYQPLLILIGLLCTLLLLFLAGVIVLGGSLGVPGLIAMTTALVSMYRPLENWLESRRLLRRGRESAVPLFRFLEQRGDVGQVVGAEFLEPLKRGIDFDNVSLREPGSNRMLLEEVTLEIPAGKRIGLIGADSLEKHALIYLIPRLLDPTSGEIRIDQHNLRWVTLDSLRNQIATVLQHNLVFHDTIANNIGCGDPSYTLPQIIDAAKMAHAHHFIQKLPQGYETPIGELGHALSVSQQYRIALARAILRDPALLIIEEPEIPLDEDTKSLLDDTMARLLPGRTAIFIPHRISTIRSCDTLYLLHRGKIVASGQHKELLGSHPIYRHLHYIEFNEIADQI